jgi:hypothetical protein
MDHLSTREALELELALTAYMSINRTVGGSNRDESLFSRSGSSGEHLVISLKLLYTIKIVC